MTRYRVEQALVSAFGVLLGLAVCHAHRTWRRGPVGRDRNSPGFVLPRAFFIREGMVNCFGRFRTTRRKRPVGLQRDGRRVRPGIVHGPAISD